LLWGGHRDEARAVLARISQSSLPEENKLIAQLRQACADGGNGATVTYAELAADAGFRIRGAELIGTVLQEAIDAGSGDNYFPVIAKHIDNR
jgi:hypothetical protein